MTMEEVSIPATALSHHGFLLWVLAILVRLDLGLGVNARPLLPRHRPHHHLPTPLRHPTPLEIE